MKRTKEGTWTRSLTKVAVAALLFTAPAASAVWINELHYDNSGADVGEFVEIAGISGTDLSGWSLVFYNGGDGTPYGTLNLSGLIDDESNGYGALSFARSGIQNDKDGLALVNGGIVMQFLSYEGTFTATSGVANGLLTVDLGVSQQPAPASGNTLQLTGNWGAFTWTGPTTASPGSLNAGQVFPPRPIDPGPTTGVPDTGATWPLLGLVLVGLGCAARRGLLPRPVSMRSR